MYKNTPKNMPNTIATGKRIGKNAPKAEERVATPPVKIGVVEAIKSEPVSARATRAPANGRTAVKLIAIFLNINYFVMAFVNFLAPPEGLTFTI